MDQASSCDMLAEILEQQEIEAAEAIALLRVLAGDVDEEESRDEV